MLELNYPFLLVVDDTGTWAEGVIRIGKQYLVAVYDFMQIIVRVRVL